MPCHFAQIEKQSGLLLFSASTKAITCYWPVFNPFDKSALHRLTMHVCQHSIPTERISKARQPNPNHFKSQMLKSNKIHSVSFDLSTNKKAWCTFCRPFPPKSIENRIRKHVALFAFYSVHIVVSFMPFEHKGIGWCRSFARFIQVTWIVRSLSPVSLFHRFANVVLFEQRCQMK